MNLGIVNPYIGSDPTRLTVKVKNELRAYLKDMWHLHGDRWYLPGVRWYLHWDRWYLHGDRWYLLWDRWYLHGDMWYLAN